jgi:uncharacterized membrane protein YkvA (DUF1232 family)
MLEKIRSNPILRTLVALVCVGYLLFPSFGIFELVPDNLPLVGNLDEFAFAFILFVVMDWLPWVSNPSVLRWAVLGAIGVVSLIYLLNPTAGVLEFIPDNFPIIGNLDDAVAAFGFSAMLSQALAPRLAAERQRREEQWAAAAPEDK